MNKKNDVKKGKNLRQVNSITSVTVSGYKSINQPQTVEIRPLTIIAGANSSGKSSIIQPLLLLKQTLEESFDPGPLQLDGKNVNFTSASQFLPRVSKNDNIVPFSIGLEIAPNLKLAIEFHKQSSRKLEIKKMTYDNGEEKLALRLDMNQREIEEGLPKGLKNLPQLLSEREKTPWEWEVIRQRCFLALALRSKDKSGVRFPMISRVSPSGIAETYLRGLIHVPGLRGNPERYSPVAAIGENFPGRFENYTASVISRWQEESPKKISALGKDLAQIGLTWKVIATPINDTQVELQVGRLSQAASGGAKDLVNIADVGFGVSQTLPVLVALHVAEPGQLVYIEQPEIHLHPRAQTAMANVLADAAKRGVRVIIETHSSLLLLGIQTLIAEEKLSPDLVKLHWFSRDENGATSVRSAELDEVGAFGDWPVDFAETSLKAQSRYLDAAEAKMMGNGNGLR